MKIFYPDYPNLEFVLRLLVAALLGGVVGLERELRAKEAGIRTHFLVALGSALLMIISQYGFSEAPGRAADPSRLAAQVVSGIGFLCAGTIVFRREAVKGLTTAAGLWVAAGIEMAAGSEIDLYYENGRLVKKRVDVYYIIEQQGITPQLLCRWV